MPALAPDRPGQPVRHGQVLHRRARGRASSPSSAAMSGSAMKRHGQIRNDARRACCCWRRIAPATCACANCSPPPISRRVAMAAPKSRAASWPGRQQRLIALSGGPLGDIGQMLAAGKPTRPMCAPRPGRNCSPAPITSRCSARAAATARGRRGAGGRQRRPRGAPGPAAGGDASGAVPQRDDFKAHEARVCIAEGYVLGDKRRPTAFQRGTVLQDQRRDGRAVRRPAGGLAELGRDRAALQPHGRTGQEPPAGFPDPGRRAAGGFLASESHAGLERRLELLYPDAAERESQRPTYAERLEFEIATIVRWASPAIS
jgi:hypothetical protein